MIWTALKQTGSDIWDELLNMLIFNVITLVGTVLIIPWPFVTFGLFEMAYDIGQGKGVKFLTFFSRAAEVWRQAYLWGIINLGVIVIVLANVKFYGNFIAPWASVAQILMMGLAVFWFALQLIALPIYPRLEDPGFKIAMRNAAVLLGRYPVPSLTILVVVGVMVALTLVVQQCNWFVLLGIFSVTAVLCNRMVGAMVRKELSEKAGDIDREDQGVNLDHPDEAQ